MVLRAIANGREDLSACVGAREIYAPPSRAPVAHARSIVGRRRIPPTSRNTRKLLTFDARLGADAW